MRMMKVKSGAITAAAILMIGLFPVSAFGATLFYEDFSSGLDLWTTGGGLIDIMGFNGESWARFQDVSNTGNPYLYYNAVALTGADDHLFEFDLNPRMTETSTDTFSVYLYYTNDPLTFSPFVAGNTLDILFNLRGNVFYDVHEGVTITDKPIGSLTWKNVAYDFSTSDYSHVIPFFTLRKGDAIQNSNVWLDNVRFDGPVPEPATSLIFGLGLLGLGIARKRIGK